MCFSFTVAMSTLKVLVNLPGLAKPVENSYEVLPESAMWQFMLTPLEFVVMDGIKEDLPALFNFFKLVKAFHRTAQIFEDDQISLETEDCTFDFGSPGDLELFAAIVIGQNQGDEFHKFSMVAVSELSKAFFHTWAHAGLYLNRSLEPTKQLDQATMKMRLIVRYGNFIRGIIDK